MKVTLLPENLIGFIPLINKVLPTHSQVPILSNVLLEAGKDGFFVKATDLGMGVVVKIPAKIETEGAITVPGKEFLETINSLPKDKIVITVEKETAVITCRGNKISFNTISNDEFPQLYKKKGEEVARFTRQDFDDIFSYLTFSVSYEESRPQLTGVYVDSSGEKVNFVSTDGYRMSVKSFEGKKKIKESQIVAVGLLNEVMALKNENEIVFYTNKEENQILFEIADTVLVGRMIEGAFPDYARVIPKSAKTTVVFDREELLRSVKIASVFARDNSNITTLEIKADTIKLITKAQGVGDGEIVTDCEKKGEDNKISFNIRYLLDLLKTLTEKSVTLKLNSSTEPALFEVKEKDFLHVIMPIQVEG